MPVTLAPIDVELTITKVMADEKTRKHLESLGVLQNAKIIIVSSKGGNVIIQSKGVRLALNKDVAKKIFVA